MRSLKSKVQNEMSAASAAPLAGGPYMVRGVLGVCSRVVAVGARSGERDYGKGVSSEKGRRGVRKKAAPLELLAKNAGVLRVFPEVHAAPLGPLGKCPGFFDGFGLVDASRRCASGKKVAVVAINNLTGRLNRTLRTKRDVTIRDTVVARTALWAR